MVALSIAKHSPSQVDWLCPYRAKHLGSEKEGGGALIILGWQTAWELRVPLAFFFFFLSVAIPEFIYYYH